MFCLCLWYRACILIVFITFFFVSSFLKTYFALSGQVRFMISQRTVQVILSELQSQI